MYTVRYWDFLPESSVSSDRGAEGVSYAIILGNLLVPLIEKFTMPVAFGRKAGAKREK